MMISFKFLLENFEIIFQRRLTLVEYNTGCAKKEVFFFLHTLLPYIFFYIFEEHIFQRISLSPVSSPQAVFSNLEEGIDYSTSVQALTKAGPGPWSTKLSLSTARDMVRAPLGVKALATSDQSVEVWWKPVPAGRGKILGYQVGWSCYYQ